MRKLKVGLALGSGAARGLAHIGVIRALEENDIQVNMISGTSIGAVIGSFYAIGLTIERMTEFALGFGRKRVMFWMDPSFFRTGGILKGEKIEQALREFAGSPDFKDLKVPFYIVTSDLITGKEVVLSEGDVFNAVRASFSIPGVFSPVRHNEQWLLDGAVVAPVPTRVLREHKCDVIIAVDVGNELSTEWALDSGGTPGTVDVMIQALSMMEQKITEPCMRLADVRIVPPLGSHSWTDFSHAEELIETGYRTTIEHIPAIKRLIWRRKYLLLRRLFQ